MSSDSTPPSAAPPSSAVPSSPAPTTAVLGAGRRYDLDSVLDCARRLGAVAPWVRLDGELALADDDTPLFTVEVRISLEDGPQVHNPWNEEVRRDVALTRARNLLAAFKSAYPTHQVRGGAAGDAGGGMTITTQLGPNAEASLEILEEQAASLRPPKSATVRA